MIPEIILQARGGEMVVDTSLIFRLSEVYPALREELSQEVLSLHSGGFRHLR